MVKAPSIIFQPSKLGDIPYILKDLDQALALFNENKPVGRIYGVSGGALTAMAFGLALAARNNPDKWGKAASAITDFRSFLSKAHSWNIRCFNLNPWYGRSNLTPLRRWLANRLKFYTGRSNWKISELGIPLYICTMDRDAIFTMFGPENDTLQSDYQYKHMGPPTDAVMLDAVIAALSTLLSTSHKPVDGKWVYDCRPPIVDAGAIVADLEATDPRPILRSRPHAVIRQWPLNFISSVFIMHSQHERNQALLADYYLDLLRRQRELIARVREKQANFSMENIPASMEAPILDHVNLPYMGSAEAATNMRQSVENRVELMARFSELLNGQLDSFPFNKPANIIYGAGGFSGILGGMVTTRAVNEGFKRGGGEIKQIYGVSAGVLNGFFHSIEVAAARHPDLYKPAASHALQDLEDLIAHLEPNKLLKMNINPFRFWHGWASLEPLEEFLKERLTAYTGTAHPEQVTFDDIALPMTVTAARADGFTDFLGMTGPDRRFEFGGQTWKVLAAPVTKAVIAGWTMNTYIEPANLNGQMYRDGGGTFYDPSLLVACLDPELTNLIDIHLDYPESGTEDLPYNPDVPRIILDTHNYTFPEEQRRMRVFATLFYNHFRLRKYAAGIGIEVEPDFRRKWKREDTGYL